MRRVSLIIAVLAFFLVALPAVGCTAPPVKPPPDRVTLQLKWYHQAQFAGFYWAQEKGYYDAENLRVNFLEAEQGTNLVSQVVGGKADFGVDSADSLLLARSRGKPVTAVAVIYQRSPVIFLTLAGSGIMKPADFLDKTIALEGEAFIDARLQYLAMMEKLGLDSSRVKIVPYEYDFASFKKGEAQVTYCYSTGGLIRLLQQGIQVNRILPSDYGIHVYSDTLFTSDSLVKANPGLVERFVRASLLGWRDAVGDPDEAVRITLLYAREKDSAIQSGMMERQLPLVYTGEEPVGGMLPEVWSGMQVMMLSQKLLDQPLDPTSVYTLDYLNKIYGGGSR